MADESDRPADLLRYWELLQEGKDCVFRQPLHRGWGSLRLPAHQADTEPRGKRRHPGAFLPETERHHERLQSLPARGDPPPASLWRSPHFRADGRAALEGHPAWIHLGHAADRVAQPPDRHCPNCALREMGSRYLRCIWRLWRETSEEAGRLRQAFTLTGGAGGGFAIRLGVRVLTASGRGSQSSNRSLLPAASSQFTGLPDARWRTASLKRPASA